MCAIVPSLRIPMLLLVAYASAAGRADCAREYDTAKIVEAAEMAERYFMRADAPGFESSRQAMESRLPCSKDILNRAAIARVHRTQALGAMLDERMDLVPQALAGLFTAEPGHQVPPALLPFGHPIRELVPAAMLALQDDVGVELPRLASGWVEVDGVHATKAPAQRAAVLQQIDNQGAVLATRYRWRDEAGFGWMVPGAGVPEAIVLPVGSASSGGWVRRGSLLAVTVASLATSGVLFALAADARAEFEGSPVMGIDASDASRESYRGEMEALQGRTNGLTWGFYGSAGAGLALGAATVITW